MDRESQNIPNGKFYHLVMRISKCDRVKTLLLVVVLHILSAGIALAQYPVRIHSHNDYTRRLPFYQAYAQQAYSIEADIYTGKTEGELLVAHDRHELEKAATLDELYIEPIVSLYKLNGGRAWRGSENALQLLIDLKTPVHPTLDWLIAKLDRYPEVFDPSVNPYAVRVVISGNRPAPSDFTKYPSCIRFDGRIDVDYTPAQLERIALISENFRKYSVWDGKGAMAVPEKEKVMAVTDKAHAWGKPMRFWGAPDGVVAWNTFYRMGIDFINTDKPEACADFFIKFDNKTSSLSRVR